MTLFWTLAGAMSCLALFFLLPPLLQSSRNSAISTEDLNKQIFRHQLSELEADLSAGNLDQSQFDSAVKDLQRELLYDLSQSGSDTATKKIRSGRWAIVLLLPIIPLAAVLLYQQLGSNGIIPYLDATLASTTPTDNAQTTQPGSLKEMVSQLAGRLTEHPDDANGWALLARSYMALNRYDDAVKSYARVHELVGDHPELLTSYVDALVVGNGGAFTDQSSGLLQRALQLDPDNVKALWMTGHWKYTLGAYTEAIEYWQTAVGKLPADSEDAQLITQQIAKARNLLDPADTVPSVAVAEQSGAGSIKPVTQSETKVSVRITLDPRFSEAVSPEDTLFVFARAVQGPRMPLAIVRKQVKDLPLTVTLNDTQAMSPAMVLSNFDQVTVEARISRSGNAMPQSGDLQGSASPVKTEGTETVQLTIDAEVP